MCIELPAQPQLGFRTNTRYLRVPTIEHLISWRTHFVISGGALPDQVLALPKSSEDKRRQAFCRINHHRILSDHRYDSDVRQFKMAAKMVLINGVEVGTTGFGLMGKSIPLSLRFITLTQRAGLTWRPNPTHTSQALKTMKAAVANKAVFWNAGTFYGPPTANSLQLLNAYFTEYPEDASKVTISVKGPIAGDEVSVRRTVNECLRVLDGTKHLDIFQCARVDPRTPIEETMQVLAQCIQEGKLSSIGLSEPKPEMIRRAAAVHKIACVEVEFSLFATEILHNGIAATCAELGIPIVAYSPLGRGFLVRVSLMQLTQKTPHMLRQHKLVR